MVRKPKIPQILDIPAVAERIGVSRQWVDQMRTNGELPDPDIVLGQSPGWLVATIDEWDSKRSRRKATA
jgi:predicted DNA-binding transcriptional regulator AlpA